MTDDELIEHGLHEWLPPTEEELEDMIERDEP